MARQTESMLNLIDQGLEDRSEMLCPTKEHVENTPTTSKPVNQYCLSSCVLVSPAHHVRDAKFKLLGKQHVL